MTLFKKQKAIVAGNVWEIVWSKDSNGGSFDYRSMRITIGVRNNCDQLIFEILCHELMEICAVVCHARLTRSDSVSDYIFVADHKTFDTQVCLFASAIKQFIK